MCTSIYGPIGILGLEAGEVVNHELYYQLTGVNHRPQSRLTGEIIPTQIFYARIFTELVKQDQAKSTGLA